MNHQSKSSRERRRHPRLMGNIPVKIYSEDFDIVTETKNLSCSGAYCRVNRYIEPMTKLKVHLILSLRKDSKVVSRKVSCCGVVVRTESLPGEDFFNIAIYFNEIQKRDAECLAEYVESSMGAAGGASPQA